MITYLLYIENTIEMGGKGTKGRKPNLSCHKVRRKYQLLFFWGKLSIISVRSSKCASCITYAKE